MSRSKTQKKDPILQELAALVRNRRYELNLTQEEVAERAGLHVNYIGGIERALRNPSLTTLVALANGLDCSIHNLFK